MSQKLSSPVELTAFVRRELAAVADSEKAGIMAAYMKTEMPFYGVQKAGREKIFKALKSRFHPQDHQQYQASVQALWALPHREEKYLAIQLARAYRPFITPQSLALYERLIRQGAWWDLVDEVASHLVGATLLQHRQELSPVIDQWLEDDDMWIRRTALICQIRHKAETDHQRLFRYCLTRAAEKEFFIRKAIGWALREYSKAAPDRVCEFLKAHQSELSSLSYREGAKRLRVAGYDI